MNEDPLTVTLTQISQLVSTFNKKNLQQSSRQIGQVRGREITSRKVAQANNKIQSAILPFNSPVIAADYDPIRSPILEQRQAQILIYSVASHFRTIGEQGRRP